MIPRWVRSLGPALLAVVAAAGADAQSPPPNQNPPPNQTCIRLESQLAALDRGAADPARADQVKRYEEAVSRQQFELDRTIAQARRTGCEGSGFFLFGGGQPPQCDQLNNQIQRMRANLDRMIADLQRLRSGGRADLEGQRRAILIALGQNNCGPQYRSAAPAGPRGLFDTLFGNNRTDDDAPNTPPSGTFRTLCVRTCDGFYFPISYSTVPTKFQDDERTCQRMCPAAEAVLYAYRNPGEDVAQAVSISGRPYSDLPNAFKYRTEFNPACSCRGAGQTWAEAMRPVQDDTIERGDIVVTDETSRTMSQPTPPPQTKAGKQGPRTKGDTKGQTAAPPTPPAAPPAPPPTADTTPPQAAPDGKRTVRTVGPTFMPSR